MANKKTEEAAEEPTRPATDPGETAASNPAASAAAPEDPLAVEPPAPDPLEEPAAPDAPAGETRSGAGSSAPLEGADPFAPDPAAGSGPATWSAPPPRSPDADRFEMPPDAAEPGASEPVEYEAEEDRGWSFAARALAFLLLLLVGAGLGIWAAPRIAPLLPSGLAPVAAWLTPSAPDDGAEAAVAAVESRVATLESQVAALPDAAAVESGAAVAAEAVRADLAALAGRVDEVGQRMDQAAGSDVGARVGALETAVEGATAELATLRSQIDSGAGASADASQSIDTYRAELEGLRAEVSRLAGTVSGLGAELAEAQAAAAARIAAVEDEAAQVEQAATAARDTAAARADVALIRAALASGAPYQEPLDALAAQPDVTVPDGLRGPAATGVATPAQLRAQFSDAAHGAIRANIEAGADGGLVARSRAFLEAQVASRSLTPQEGSAPDAVLSRMEDALRRDDLRAAIAEADQLPSEAQAAMQDWLAAARARADAEAGLAELSAAVSPTN